ncbi:hypothetical protein CHS0354_036056 [Potamilus streckersoni]|uniref:DUF3719 domain-containing protein n=1 Tax=Potamilus streckersoni TaxID=2493646 RepID=A0AAE0VW87_9BIVA|nr:hypothetical protein CHS0354_036056 [Potamilus streckersoni]
MTGRYIRRPIPLEIRGLPSRLTVDQDVPNSYQETTTVQQVPKVFSNAVNEAITSYRGSPSNSGRSSPTLTEEIDSTASIPQTTGNTTERSSIDSNYFIDEFDRQAAKTVQALFDEIDSVLFEQSSNRAEYIYNECQEWIFQFPHLRLLGRQLIPPQDTGYQFLERDVSRPSTTGSMGLMDITEMDMFGTQDNSQGLNVMGKQLKTQTLPVDVRSQRNSMTSSDKYSSEFSHLEEEVFESDGEYEEMIAVDYKDIYEDSSDQKMQLTPRRRRVGYPPITPNASLKDSVASSAFDSLWQEIISWIRDLLKKFSAIVLDEHKPLIIPMQDTSTHQPLEPPSSSHLPHHREQFNPKYITRAHTIVGSLYVDPTKLDGVLQISRKVVNNRDPSHLHDLTENPIVTARPASSIIPPSNKRPVSVWPGHARSRGSGAMVRLAPITHDRSKTPSVQDEDHGAALDALRVKKLNPVSGRISSPPAINQRVGALPPIPNYMEEPLTASRQASRKGPSSRASSAIDKDLRVPYRERMIPQEGRPSTTHAMRSDTPLGVPRRASTPFGSSLAFSPANTRSNTFGGSHMMALNITGCSLQPSSDHLGQVPQEILEDSEMTPDDVIKTKQWNPSTTGNNPYKRARQMSSLVRS